MHTTTAAENVMVAGSRPAASQAATTRWRWSRNPSTGANGTLNSSA
jgi:hypothetical protein